MDVVSQVFELGFVHRLVTEAEQHVDGYKTLFEVGDDERFVVGKAK